VEFGAVERGGSEGRTMDGEVGEEEVLWCSKVGDGGVTVRLCGSSWVRGLRWNGVGG